MFTDHCLTQINKEAAVPEVALETLEWRSSVVGGDELAAIREEYCSTPSLEDTKPRWSGDMLDLIDVVVADLNVDLDLRLSPLFESDRSRDIGLVAIRDAPLHSIQYTDLLRHLDAQDNAVVRRVLDQNDRGEDKPLQHRRCHWQCESPLAPMIATAETVETLLSTRLDGDQSEQCAAILRDLKDAIVRCDTVQRLRTTTIFLYFATAWADRIIVAAGLEGIDVGCREILHFYVHLAAWEDMPKLKEVEDVP